MKSVIIVAGGASKRFGKNKLKEEIFDKSVLQHSVDAFLGIADEIIVVGKYSVCGAKCVKAGSTRNKSVRNGVKAVSPQCTLLAIHDGARPFVSRSLVQKLFDEAQKFGSAVPCLPVTDTLWENTDGVAQRRERNNFFTVQTPQVFHYEKLVCALQNFPKDFPDESTLFSQAYGEVHFVEGERSNRKLTVAQDLPVYRVGNGFDVHAFGEGNGFVLGGVHIPFDKKIAGTFRCRRAVSRNLRCRAFRIGQQGYRLAVSRHRRRLSRRRQHETVGTMRCFGGKIGFLRGKRIRRGNLSTPENCPLSGRNGAKTCNGIENCVIMCEHFCHNHGKTRCAWQRRRHCLSGNGLAVAKIVSAII